MGQLAAVLVSGGVALVVGGIGVVVALVQVRRERRRWMAGLSVAWSVELHRARIATYPEAMSALLPLSEASTEPPNKETAWHVAERLNAWLYSAGGLCASATTRGALLGLRQHCRRWAADGRRPDDLYEWRDLLIAFLRYDLDLPGLEDYDFDLEPSQLARFQAELRRLDRATDRRAPR